MTARWIAVDWGVSRLRAWGVGSGGEAVWRADSKKGMGALAPEEFEPALRELVSEHVRARTRVVVCGMAGARQGWIEAPYCRAPCAPVAAAGAVSAPAADRLLDVRILPGVEQADPPDVMRGEETQIAGLLARDPDFDGAVCLPGTHSKWVRVGAGRIVGFRTFMTGELFALLSRNSVLRHALGGDEPRAGERWDQAAFLAAAEEALARPETLTADLFALRAAQLLEGLPPDAARARLSGLLIGAELAGARSFWQDGRVALVGASGLAAHYAGALAAGGAAAEVEDDAALTLAGLAAAHAGLRDVSE